MDSNGWKDENYAGDHLNNGSIFISKTNNDSKRETQCFCGNEAKKGL